MRLSKENWSGTLLIICKHLLVLNSCFVETTKSVAVYLVLLRCGQHNFISKGLT